MLSIINDGGNADQTHDTPLGRLLPNHPENLIGWSTRGKTGSLVHRCWEYKIVQPP